MPQNTIPYFLGKVNLLEFVHIMQSPATQQTILQKSTAFPARAVRSWHPHQILAAELADATGLLRSTGFCSELCAIAQDLVSLSTPRRDQVRKFMNAVYSSLALDRAEAEDMLRGLKSQLCLRPPDGPFVLYKEARDEATTASTTSTALEQGDPGIDAARDVKQCRECLYRGQIHTNGRPETPDLSCC